MTRAAHLLRIFLASVILLTAQSAAMARAMPDPSGQMVICSGATPIMVYFDENGEPTAAPHLCPDFALSMILTLDVDPILISHSGSWSKIARDRFVHSAAFLQPTRGHPLPPFISASG